ncbi:hypothetical protein VIGAN_01062800 [Vigna angularis var. angularis]|uniref:Uncharacterized protein n=1 Tax=Vigna angularis var. angularis TaxID=157739 RepID=A0A0S3QXT2_PHAAN|nr:hypothetical protein VIGAN_01062800 [Vigna angularis var. angularis]
MNFFWKIELGFASFESESCFIVSKCSSLRGGKSSQPNSGCFLRVANLRGPLPPWSLSHSSVLFSCASFTHSHITRHEFQQTPCEHLSLCTRKSRSSICYF